MEIKRKYLLISLTSILCGMLLFFYACMEEEKETDERKEFSSELEFGKNKELTKSIAKEWYQTSQKPVTRMVRDEGDDLGGVLVMPSWNHAKEWKKGKYEVVESSLKTQKGIIFVDNETREKIDSESADLTKIKNIGRMVFLKDMETGEIINFNMVVIASYKYLMKEDNQLSKNTYLEREANFDGTILFYHPDGRFVNGWRYDNGKITHRLSPLEELNPLTKAWVQRCDEVCYSYSENICENSTETDAEFGEMAVVECRTEWYDDCYTSCQMEWEDDPHEPDDVEGGYEPGGGGGGNNISIKVPNGDCVIGTIAEALRRLTKIAPSVKDIRTFIKENYTYTPGEGVLSTQVSWILEKYFEITLFADEKMVTNALDKGQLVVANDKGMKHAVLIDGYRIQNGKVVFNHYDSVDGRSYQTALGSDRYDMFIIKKVIKK